MKHNHFIVVLFSIMMSAFLVSCDDKNAQDPFAGIDLQKGVKKYPYSTTELLKIVKMGPERLHPLNSTETKHWRNIWFQGYIVGCYDVTGDSAQVTAPYSTNENILVAQSPDERDQTKMVLVPIVTPYWKSQLGIAATEGGSKSRLVKFGIDLIPIETQLENPTLAQTKNLTGFWWVTEDTGLVLNNTPYLAEDFSSPIGTAASMFQEQRATSFAIWKTVVYAGAAKAAQGVGSSYVTGVSGETPPAADESWLVSKAISLPDYEYATLSFVVKPGYVVPFNTANGVYDPTQEFMLFVAELTEGETFVNPLTASERFVQLELSGFPFAPMEAALAQDFTSYAGKKIQIAFKYKSVRWYKAGGKPYPQTWSITALDLR